MDNSYQLHWEKIFSSTAHDRVSWFQSYPSTSIDFIDSLHIPVDANIIDVGGGDSHLVDALLDKGYQHLYVLDISANAIERAKKRLGTRASRVHWIVSDVIDFIPPVKFDLWHDRAAFHFLLTEEKIDKYVSIAKKSLKEGGHAIIGTFSENGPGRCSGLNVRQYSETSMGDTFKEGFRKLKCIKSEHVTPDAAIQHFIFCAFKRC
jgi:SAM-dependent methyltransferase